MESLKLGGLVVIVISHVDTTPSLDTRKMVIEQLRCDLTLRHPLDAGRNF
jgi:hypothetical protein